MDHMHYCLSSARSINGRVSANTTTVSYNGLCTTLGLPIMMIPVIFVPIEADGSSYFLYQVGLIVVA